MVRVEDDGLVGATLSGRPQDAPDVWIVRVNGVDIYDPVSGAVSSASIEKVAAWFLDTDYDGRCFCICQAFFPQTTAWDKLARALKGNARPGEAGEVQGTRVTALPAREAPGRGGEGDRPAR